MTTPVTEISYPPLDSQATYTFIESQVDAAALTGDLQTDFKEALYIQLALSNPRGSSGYSLDDLWKRYVINSIAADSNTAAGNPATAAGAGNPKGHKGNSIKHYYPPGLLKNPGNANKFPAGTAFNISNFNNIDNYENVLINDGRGMCWNADGTALIIQVDNADHSFVTITMDTAYSAFPTNGTGAVADGAGTRSATHLCNSLEFSNNGALLTGNGETGTLCQWDLSTAYDVTTASLAPDRTHLTGAGASAGGVFNDDGTVY
jgi:hypothetical protein